MKRNGCYNREPITKPLIVFDGYADAARMVPVTKAVPFRMATDCRYTLTKEGRADARCDGCKHRAEA